MNMNTRLALPVVAALAMGMAGSASAQFGKPSKNDQIKLGQRAAQEIRQKERVLPASDPRVQTVRRVGQRLLSAMDSRNSDWQYSFDVVNKGDLNAFALPGGPTFIYTGLLERMRSEDELAGVMAHELAHVQKEHWASQYGEQQKRNLGLSLLLIFTRANRTVGDLASLGSQVFFDLPYSRRHETESDDLAFETMVRAGYNPQGLVDVFTLLRDASKGGKPPEWLSSHPGDNNRIGRIQSRIQQANTSYPAMRRLDFNYYDRYDRYERNDGNRYRLGGRG